VYFLHFKINAKELAGWFYGV